MQFKDVIISKTFWQGGTEYVKTSHIFAVRLNRKAAGVVTETVAMLGTEKVWVEKELVVDEKPKKSFRPDDFNSGSALTGVGMIVDRQGHYTDRFEQAYNQGIWRATREGAEKLRDYRAALQRVRKWKYENCEHVEFDSDIPQYEIRYCTTRFMSFAYFDSQTDSPIGMFKKEDDVYRCINACEGDLRIIFGVE